MKQTTSVLALVGATVLAALNAAPLRAEITAVTFATTGNVKFL